MRILIAGDLCPVVPNYELFKTGDVVALLGQELFTEWMAADFRIFNLETVLTDDKTPISKRGPALSAPTYTIAGISALKPQLLNTANNHILDHGEQGYSTTIALLNANNIPYVGSGMNLEQSALPYIINEEKKIGIYACADYEFTIATDKSSGANPFDPTESFDHIRELKRNCDHVIVLYHGAKEYYRYPTPYIRKICHKMVDNGADVVILQHSHCIGCKESYKDSVIVYGQGNFIFGRKHDEFTTNGLLIKLIIEEEIKTEFIPIIKSGNTTMLANQLEKEQIIDSFLLRSEQILENGFIENEFRKLCKSYHEQYYANTLNHPKWLRKLNHIFGNKLFVYGRNHEHTLFLSNLLACDAHRELFLNILKEEREKWI